MNSKAVSRESGDSTKKSLNGFTPTHKSGDKRKTRKEPLTHIDWPLGWDTEYLPATGKQGYQTPVTSQIAIPGVEVIPLDLIAQLAPELLSYELNNNTLQLVFDDRGIKTGRKYARHIMYILEALVDYFYPKFDPKKHRLNIHLWTFFSNAELANIIPDIKAVKGFMQKNRDSVKDPSKSRTNTRLVPIQKTLLLSNWRLMEGVTISVRDVRHLYYKPSLDDLGKSIGIPKLEHPDWDKENALQWLARDPEAYFAYAGMDAEITVMAALLSISSRNELIEVLSSKGVIPPVNHPQVKRLLKSIPLTTSGTAGQIAKLVMIAQGKWDKYRNFKKDLKENILCPNAWNKTKGGLNKRFDSDKPSVIKGVDVYDISGAYLTALKYIELGLDKPNYYQSNGWTTAKEIAKEISNKHHSGYYNLEFQLPEGTSEHNRVLVVYDYENDNGVTARMSGDKQWYTHWEIQALAAQNPDCPVFVHGGWYWLPGCETVNLGLLMETLAKLRTEYKGKGDKAMEQMVKLLGNGIAGKIGQQTNSWDTDLSHDALMLGCPLSAIGQGKVIESPITNTLYFNFITGYIRACIAVVSARSNAYMCVTDSVICPSGSFVPSKEINTGYKHLDNALHSLDWTKEYENVDGVIYKERDYFLFKAKDKNSRKEFLEVLLEEREFTQAIKESIDICKVAKRGFKADPSLKTELERNWDFVTKSIPRLKGFPMVFPERKLTGGKDMLLEKGTLNSSEDVVKTIGSHNNRFDCTDLQEFRSRNRLKELVKQRGYADEAHCKLVDPLLYEKLSTKCKAKPHHKNSLPLEVQRAVATLGKNDNWSCRKLAEILKVGKSTINRWVKEFSQALEKGVSFTVDNPFQVISDWVGKNQSVPQPTLGTHP